MRHDDVTDNKIYCRCLQTFQGFLAIGGCMDGIGISQIFSQKLQHIRRVFHYQKRVTGGFALFLRSGNLVGHGSDGRADRDAFLQIRNFHTYLASFRIAGIDINLSFMLLHQQFDETQSDSHSRSVVSCVSYLIKRFENLAALLLWNTRTVVTHTQGERAPFRRQMFVHNYHNAGTGIFHGICQQVADNFSQRLLVYIILQVLFRQRDAERYSGQGDGTETVDDVLYHPVDIHFME